LLKASKFFDCRGEEKFVNIDGEIFLSNEDKFSSTMTRISSTTSTPVPTKKDGQDPQKEEEEFVNIDGEIFLSNEDAIFINNDAMFINNDADKRKVL
jgi:hypothetical protein